MLQQNPFLFQFNVPTPGFSAVIESDLGEGRGIKLTIQSPFSFIATSESIDGPFEIMAVAGTTMFQANLNCFTFSFFQGETLLFTTAFPPGIPCLFPTN